MAKVALITGVTGQDGALLAAHLLGKGYWVHGLRLYSATDDLSRLRELQNNPDFHLHYGDLTDAGALHRLMQNVRPDEIYNLAGLSHVAVSFFTPVAAVQINTIGTTHLLDAMRNIFPKARFYQASSSEMFGNAPAPQNEETPMQPCSPYGVSKLGAYWMARNYRNAYGLHISNGILFNHESTARGGDFVTRKITRAVAAIEAGGDAPLRLGNLEARRDWGHARDYVDGMWRMLQEEVSGDYVLATGRTHSVREFVVEAFAYVGIKLFWRGLGEHEQAFDARTGRMVVAVDPQFYRPAELHTLIGDAAKAARVLGWRPSTSFETLVREMVDADRALIAGDFDYRLPDDELLAAE